jgi:1-aminocyclopropane-1-carboxylate deaminase
LLKYCKTAVTELKGQIFEQKRVRFVVKREDQNHPSVSGNKWWKLKYNLEEAIKNNQNTILTFGGAYSNHIYATAAAARELGLRSIGIIRGEETLPLNETLKFARAHGMELHHVARAFYRTKTSQPFLDELRKEFGDFYLIPEGGTNELAVKGCAEFARLLNQEAQVDYLCLAVGTGGTIAGMIEGFDRSKKILGFPILKGAAFLEAEIKRFTTKRNWELLYDYHAGGYAKTNSALIKFIGEFEENYKLPLDPVYTGKMMWGMFDLLQNGYFPPGSTVLVLHTGGLQGRLGFNF